MVFWSNSPGKLGWTKVGVLGGSEPLSLQAPHLPILSSSSFLSIFQFSILLFVPFFTLRCNQTKEKRTERKSPQLWGQSRKFGKPAMLNHPFTNVQTIPIDEAKVYRASEFPVARKAKCLFCFSACVNICIVHMCGCLSPHM